MSFQPTNYFPKVDLTKFNDRVNARRLSKGFSLQEMSNRTGLSKSYVRNLENRPVYKPQAEMVYRVSAALSVSMEYILGIHTDLPSIKSENFYRRFLRLEDDKKNMLIKLLEAVEQV